MNHWLRAFIYQTNGLEGYLVETDVQRILKDAQKSGKLVGISKSQIVDFNFLDKQLDSCKTLHDKISLLRQHYPCIFLFVLKSLNTPGLIQVYTDKYKCLEHGEVEQYSQYIHGYWIPELESRKQSKLYVKGKPKICA